MKLHTLPLLTLFLIPSSAVAQDACSVQKELRRQGYYDGPTTCLLGPRTLDALRLFQQERGLVPDGILGRDTRKALFEGVDNDRKSPRVVERREREMSDQEEFARCSDELIEATVERGWKSRGIRGATKAWEAKARKQVGLEYGQWANATDSKASCIPTGVLSVVSCTAVGRPCKAGN